MKLLRALPLLAAAAVLHAAPARAQTLYGLAPEGNAGNERDAYRIRVRQEVIGLLAEWKGAWDHNNSKAAIDLYTRDGSFMSDAGEEVFGKPAVQARLAALFALGGPLQFGVMDFDFSGDMAYVRGQMTWTPAAGGDPHTEVFILIARRQRDDEWLIRSLTFTPMAPAPTPPPTAAAGS